MPELILFAIPVFVGSILLELGWAKRRGAEWYDARDTFADLSMGLGYLVISATARTVTFGLLYWVYQFGIFDIPHAAIWAWIVLIIAEDFCYYWFHRAHHRVRFMWAAHVNHHSSQRFNLAVALRQSWTTPLTGFVFWWPLALIGFHPLMILSAQGINLLYQFFIHTQAVKRLGPLEWVLNTPSHHRVHHGANRQYLDRNYGGIFIVWDRLFGTFEPEREPVRYGLVNNIDTYNPVRIAFHEWAVIVRELRGARSLADIRDALITAPTTLLQRAEQAQAQPPQTDAAPR